MSKVSIVQLKARKRSDGTVPLYLVLRNKKERSTVALNVSLHPRHWNEKRREVRKSYHEHRKLNEDGPSLTDSKHATSCRTVCLLREAQLLQPFLILLLLCRYDILVKIPSRCLLKSEIKS